MKKIFPPIFFIALFSTFGYSQKTEFFAELFKNSNYKKDYKIAESFISTKNYDKAIKHLLNWDSLYPNNSNLNYKIGYCYANMSSNKSYAIPFLEKAAKNVSKNYKGGYDEVNAPIDAYMWLGVVYQTDYKFGKASESFNKYITLASGTPNNKVDSITFLKNKCLNAIQIINNPVSIKIENVGNNVNTKYPEYSPMVSPDMKTIYFTTRRKECKGKKVDEKGLYYEDVFYSTKNSDDEWSKAKPLGGKINTKDHEASISISPDGKIILLYRSDLGDGNIYYSKYSESKKWSKPQKFPEPINSPYWETHACYSPDMNTLYFVSNRPGGLGGRDIWKSERNGDKWTDPINLGPNINTKFDEESPYIVPNGKSLYFSSQGHQNLGGFDIFTSTQNSDGSWSKAENIGYPINTTEDDLFYVPTNDEKHAYYSSSKSSGYGGQDLYYMSIIKVKKKIILIRGQIADAQTKEPLLANVNIISKTKDKLFVKTSSNSKNGNYQTFLLFGDEYEVEADADGYKTSKKTVSVAEDETNSEIVLNIFLEKEPIVAIEEPKEEPKAAEPIYDMPVGTTITLKNIFYDFDKSSLRPESKEDLDRLVKIMNDYKDLRIEISSHTDSYGADDYNISLSERRAESVVNYIINAGIEKTRLESRGYGESKPVAPNSTDEGRQQNRRTELKILNK